MEAFLVVVLAVVMLAIGVVALLAMRGLSILRADRREEAPRVPSQTRGDG